MAKARSGGRVSNSVPNGSKLQELSGCAPHSVWVQRSKGKCPLVLILTKLGGSLGVWLDDCEALANSRRSFLLWFVSSVTKFPASQVTENCFVSAAAETFWLQTRNSSVLAVLNLKADDMM